MHAFKFLLKFEGNLLLHIFFFYDFSFLKVSTIFAESPTRSFTLVRSSLVKKQTNKQKNIENIVYFVVISRVFTICIYIYLHSENVVYKTTSQYKLLIQYD